jgi:hypothetical protein
VDALAGSRGSALRKRGQFVADGFDVRGDDNQRALARRLALRVVSRSAIGPMWVMARMTKSGALLQHCGKSGGALDPLNAP